MSSISATRSGRFENALYLLRTQSAADGSIDVTGADVRKTLSYVITDGAGYGSIGEADVVYFEKKMQVRGPDTSMVVGGGPATVDSLTRG